MKRNNKITGFTLAEVMLAIGIMGIGMVFAACLFPAAIKEGEITNNAVEGNIIANNAISNVRMRVNEQIFGESSFPNLSSGGVTTSFKVIQHNTTLAYDHDKNSSTPLVNFSFGSDFTHLLKKKDFFTNNEKQPYIRDVVLLQQRNANRNDYMIIGAACRMTKWDGNIVVEPINATYEKGKTFITLANASDSDKLFENGIIIYSSQIHSTVLAKVVSKNGTKIELNHILQEDVSSNGGASNYIIAIYELVDGKYKNPVMSISSIRAPLCE